MSYIKSQILFAFTVLISVGYYSERATTKTYRNKKILEVNFAFDLDKRPKPVSYIDVLIFY